MKQTHNNIQVIYVLGTSYNGSSLLSYLVGAADRVVYIGELKYYNRQRDIDKPCTCGVSHKSCKFWSKLYEDDYKILERGDLLGRIKLALKIISGRKTRVNSRDPKSEYDLLDKILQTSNLDRSTTYILDSSKNLWRLNYLLECKDISIKVIYIKRDILNNVSSYIKHNFNFVFGTFSYILNHYLIERYLQINKLDYVFVDYKRLCDNTCAELDKVMNFLDLEKFDYVEKMIHKKFHVNTGNPSTQKQLREGFKKIQYRSEYTKFLTKWQISILSRLEKWKKKNFT